MAKNRQARIVGGYGRFQVRVGRNVHLPTVVKITTSTQEILIECKPNTYGPSIITFDPVWILTEGSGGVWQWVNPPTPRASPRRGRL